MADNGELNLIVADDDYAALAKAYRKYADLMEGKYDSYIGLLSRICEEGVSDGEVFRNLQGMKNSAETLRGQFRNIAEKAAVACENFASNVDKADDVLY